MQQVGALDWQPGLLGGGVWEEGCASGDPAMLQGGTWQRAGAAGKGRIVQACVQNVHENVPACTLRCVEGPTPSHPSLCHLVSEVKPTDHIP